MTRSPRQSGFTLPELLVSGAVVLALIFGAFIFLHPIDYGPARRDAERWQEVAQIVQAFSRYVAVNGALPADLSTEAELIGSGEDMFNLCDLTPAYLKHLPADPTAVSEAGASCQNDKLLVSGYAIQKTAAKTVQVFAPLAETGPAIVLSRTF